MIDQIYRKTKILEKVFLCMVRWSWRIHHEEQISGFRKYDETFDDIFWYTKKKDHQIKLIQIS